MHKNVESILISEQKLEKIVNTLAKQIENQEGHRLRRKGQKHSHR